jgi:general L-amino acid transport system permease protein
MNTQATVYFKKIIAVWHNRIFRGRVYQALLIGALLSVFSLLLNNMAVNMKERGIQSGFDFLTQSAGFDIGESIFVFDSAQPYWVAFLIGLSNTVRVAVLGIVLSTLLGTVLGVGRFSKNILIRAVCQAYVAFFRNIPLLLQLLMWYILLTEFLPDADQPLIVGVFYLSKAGFSFPKPIWELGHLILFAGCIVGVLTAFAVRRRAITVFEQTGQFKSTILVPIAVWIVILVLAWILGGMPWQFDRPIMGEFAVERGGALTPEFLSLLLGLTVYTTAFVAEVVRSGIASVATGQSEAAKAIGLSRMQTMRLILLPQALRVMIPPMTNQYLNLTKNSSLAVAIGYPDIVSVANTSINQTGRAVEAIMIIMAVYLTTSLITAFLMNRYNHYSSIKER